jgi:hypothetical protein
MRPPGEALAHVVVRRSLEVEREPTRKPGAEGLPGHALEVYPDGAVRQALFPVAARDLPREPSADRAPRVLEPRREADLLLVLEGALAAFDQLVVHGVVQMVVLLLGVMDRHVLAGPRAIQDRREVYPAGLPVLDVLAGHELVRASDHLLEGAEAELGHELPDLLGHEEEEVDDVLRRPGETLPELRVLGRDARPGRCSGDRPAS